MKKSIDIETVIFKPLRSSIIIGRKYRHKYGDKCEEAIFYSGRVEAFCDICDLLGLFDEYNKWAYEHRNEVKEDAQT